MDAKIIKDTQVLLEQLSKLKRSLIHPPRPGCACDGDALCSHHAAIFNHLELASDELAIAIHAASQVD